MTGTLIARALSERGWQELRDQQGCPCACSRNGDQRYCLAHYGLMDPPSRARVTPSIVAPGYHSIYLQTFTTGRRDLANVNFQTPTEDVYRALVALLNVPVDAAGNLAACAIVSTLNTKDIRNLDYKQFRAFGAHGVAGATASASPPLPPPTYFNAQVIPDPAQMVSSDDGGVVWTGVPTGVYRITATSPTTRFASFVATCKPGRVVNANPPWGLYELG